MEKHEDLNPTAVVRPVSLWGSLYRHAAASYETLLAN